MQFSKVLPKLFVEFEKNHIDFALVGGLALYFSGVPRTTLDADFMILLTQADVVDQLMKHLGYHCLHKTDNMANYASNHPNMGQVDFLFAHRRYAMAMLQRAEKKDIFNIPVKGLQCEDLIGLKVQSSSNDPRRMAQDMADIESLLEKYARELDWSKIQDYFQIFEREAEFEALKRKFQ